MQKSIIGKIVTVTVDRPMGSYHPEHKDMYYPVNYGYIEGIIAPDGEEQDAYILGVDKAVDKFTGKIIAVVHRIDDVEEKWVVAPENMTFTKDEINRQIYFQEQYFNSEIRGKLLSDDEKTKEIVNSYVERYIVCGHTHIQQVIFNDSKIVLNPGAVGVPLNSEAKTQYMILESVGREWKYKFVSLDYDVDGVINEMHTSGLWDITPYWCGITRHLLYTGKISHGTVLNEAMRLNGYKDAWYNVDDQYWDNALKNLGIE